MISGKSKMPDFVAEVLQMVELNDMGGCTCLTRTCKGLDIPLRGIE